MGFQHRVEALTVEQRDKEWEQRLPGTTVNKHFRRSSHVVPTKNMLHNNLY